MKVVILAFMLMSTMVSIVSAQVETLVGPLSVTVTSTEEDHIIDKYGYPTRKLVNLRDSATGFIYMYEPSIRLPDVRLEFAFTEGTTAVVACLSHNGSSVSSKANNTYKAANDRFRAQYSCHLTSNNSGGGILETDAVSLYLKGKVRREKGDLTDTISQIILSGCTLSGGGDPDVRFLFNGKFSSVLLPQ